MYSSYHNTVLYCCTVLIWYVSPQYDITPEFSTVLVACWWRSQHEIWYNYRSHLRSSEVCFTRQTGTFVMGLKSSKQLSHFFLVSFSSVKTKNVCKKSVKRRDERWKMKDEISAGFVLARLPSWALPVKINSSHLILDTESGFAIPHNC